MNNIEIAIVDVTGFLSWADQFERKLAKSLDNQFEQIGKYHIAEAQKLVRQEDFYSSGQFHDAFVFEPLPATHLTGIRFYNEMPYDGWGRKPGKMPPRAAIEAWAAREGIDKSLVFVIQRSIARKGTMKRGGGRGYDFVGMAVKLAEGWTVRALNEAVKEVLS